MPYVIAAVGVLALLVAVIVDRVNAAHGNGAQPEAMPAGRGGAPVAERAGPAPSGQPGSGAAERPGAVPAVEPRPAPADQPRPVPTVAPSPAPGSTHAEQTAPVPTVAPSPAPPVEPTRPPSLVPSAHPVASAEHGGSPSWPAAAADLLRGLGRLPGVRGWAIVGAEGAVVAADPGMRTALIAGGDELARAAAAVAERLGFAEWRSVELRGPAGSIQAISGPGGWSLLALLGPEADGGRVIAEGRRILGSLGGE